MIIYLLSNLSLNLNTIVSLFLEDKLKERGNVFLLGESIVNGISFPLIVIDFIVSLYIFSNLKVIVLLLNKYESLYSPLALLRINI